MKKLIRRSALVGGLIVTLCFSAASAQSSPKTIRPPAPWEVSVANSRLSVKVQNGPLEKLIQAIGQKSGMKIILPSLGDETVSDDFSNFTLEAGLNRLLGNWNIAYYYTWQLEAAGKQAVLALSEVRVFDRNGIERRSLEAVVSLACRQAKLADKISPPRDPENDAEAARWSERLLVAANDNSREQAASHLGKLSTSESIDLLSRLATDHSDYSLRLAAVNGLGKSWSEDAITPLSQALLQDDDAMVREAAARRLGQTWSEAAVQSLLTALLNDRDPVVREQAARALGRVAGDEVVAGLTQALNHDRRWYVREAAARALESVGGREAAESLVKASSYHRDRSMREFAAVTSMNMDRRASSIPLAVSTPVSAPCGDSVP